MPDTFDFFDDDFIPLLLEREMREYFEFAECLEYRTLAELLLCFDLPAVLLECTRRLRLPMVPVEGSRDGLLMPRPAVCLLCCELTRFSR